MISALIGLTCILLHWKWTKSVSDHKGFKIEKIILYPCKALQGFEVKEWDLTPQGLENDWVWVLVEPDEKGGWRYMKGDLHENLCLT